MKIQFIKFWNSLEREKMKADSKVTIGITMGDPSGIGPEIIIKSFKRDL